MKNFSKKLALLLSTTLLTISLFAAGASPTAAWTTSDCNSLPSVWLYSQGGWYTQGPEYDEIHVCYGQYPNPGWTDLKVSGGGPATSPTERCEGIFGIDNGNFNDCLSSISTSQSGWGNGKTLCLYVNTFYNKNEGWSYISSNIGQGNLASSLNDKISSMRWVSGGSAAC